MKNSGSTRLGYFWDTFRNLELSFTDDIHEIPFENSVCLTLKSGRRGFHIGHRASGQHVRGQREEPVLRVPLRERRRSGQWRHQRLRRQHGRRVRQWEDSYYKELRLQ